LIKHSKIDRSRLAGDALAESRLSLEQHARIQQTLIDMGHLTDSADGEFGSNTRAAIRQLKAQAGDTESDFLTPGQRKQLLRGTSEVEQPAPTPKPPPPPPPPSPPPRKETARLREARIFLDDAKKFISQQTSVPSISELAKEAAALQLALDQFDERGAVESMKRLNDLLKPVVGFADFEQQQQTERNREEARHLSEGRIQAKENEFFIDGYLRSHLGETTTQPSKAVFAD
jgi:putative peptidoglycan binding protein